MYNSVSSAGNVGAAAFEIFAVSTATALAFTSVDELEAPEAADELGAPKVVGKLEAPEAVDKLEASKVANKLEASEVADKLEASKVVDKLELEAPGVVDEPEALEAVAWVESNKSEAPASVGPKPEAPDKWDMPEELANSYHDGHYVSFAISLREWKVVVNAPQFLLPDATLRAGSG